MNQAQCLIVTTHYRPLIGGALTVYDALATNSNGAISVLTASSDYLSGNEVAGWRSFDSQANYTIHRLPAMRIGLLPKTPSLMTKILARVKAAILAWNIEKEVLKRVHENKSEVVCIGAQDALGWLVYPIKKKTNAKVIIYVHGEEVSQGAYSQKAEERRGQILRAADGLVAVSSFTARILEEKYHVPRQRICLQTNGVDLDLYNGIQLASPPQEVAFPRPPFVFACGRLVERKGFDKLLEAWPRVVEAVPDASLAIGGKGPLEQSLTNIIHNLGIEDSVRMLGWLSFEQLAAMYGKADVFTMPNRTMPDGDTEGFGLVFLEAAAMGTPSVGGRAGGAVDAIIDGKTGFLVDGNKPREISDALIKLLTDETLRNTMAQQAQEHAKIQGWAQKTAEFLDYLNQLQGDTGRR